ncbi:hypothetical protein MANES_16G004500v8 [Manihot esculenta]|uniref:Uncharacterized protein n=1 Tax=Manihot esculenta TaxID=3983 RepID=A0ACB7G4Q1_MANES|nr:hypothetical protein MANES_16G004500v8 [Manihot esculenta]
MDWTRGRTIGRGSTSTVSIAKLHQSGQAIAVKSAELSRSEFLQKEQSILSALICPQIIAYKGFNITEENGKLMYNIFLEYASGGTLLDAIRKHGGWLDESIIRSYTRQILLGLRHLHSNGILHRDIKAQNILITSDGAKIADLGCARRVDEVAAFAGTPVYMAPEVARGEHQGFPADIWALGSTVVEMATGRAPWTNISDPVSALYRIGFSDNVPEIPSFMSKQAKDFLSKCLKRDPMERWSASELLEHDFITEEPSSVLKDTDVDTPTSVLEQGLWDSKEHLEATWKPTSTHKSCCHSPIERIRQLAAQGNGNMPNWAWDESWVTVRSKDSAKETFASSEDGVSGEHNLNNVIPSESISFGGIRAFMCFGQCTNHKQLSMSCICREDDFCESCNFEKEISYSLFLPPFQFI